MRVAFASSAVLAIALCISGCVGSETVQEQVSVRAEDAGSTPVIKVPTQDEMIAEIKLLPTVPGLAGECLGIGGEGSSKLLVYVEAAARASAMTYEELMAVYDFNYGFSSSIEDNETKLRVISRLVYEVPDTYPYQDPNHYWDKPEVLISMKYWTLTPLTDTKINYLYPLKFDDGNSLCVNVEPIKEYNRSGFHTPARTELEFFHATFPKRDLSAYLKEGDR